MASQRQSSQGKQDPRTGSNRKRQSFQPTTENLQDFRLPNDANEVWAVRQSLSEANSEYERAEGCGAG